MVQKSLRLTVFGDRRSWDSRHYDTPQASLRFHSADKSAPKYRRPNDLAQPTRCQALAPYVSAIRLRTPETLQNTITTRHAAAATHDRTLFNLPQTGSEAAAEARCSGSVVSR